MSNDLVARDASERLIREYGAVIATLVFYYLMRYGKDLLQTRLKEYWPDYLAMMVDLSGAGFGTVLRGRRLSNPYTEFDGTSDEVVFDLTPESDGSFTMHIISPWAKDLFDDLSTIEQEGVFDLLEHLPDIKLSDKYFKATVLLRGVKLELEGAHLRITKIPPPNDFYRTFLQVVHGVR